MDRKIVEVDLEALLKKATSIENKNERKFKTTVQQYNKVVQQNKNLQAELNNYKKVLEEIREICTTYAKTESYIIDETFSEFLEIVFNKALNIHEK